MASSFRWLDNVSRVKGRGSKPRFVVRGSEIEEVIDGSRRVAIWRKDGDKEVSTGTGGGREGKANFARERIGRLFRDIGSRMAPLPGAVALKLNIPTGTDASTHS